MRWRAETRYKFDCLRVLWLRRGPSLFIGALPALAEMEFTSKPDFAAMTQAIRSTRVSVAESRF
jgi:hypothetical protein